MARRLRCRHLPFVTESINVLVLYLMHRHPDGKAIEVRAALVRRILRIPLAFVKAGREVFRDSTTVNICNRLHKIGVDARMSERLREEGDGGSLGQIDIPDGPIRWINVRGTRISGLHAASRTEYYTDYGIPVQRSLRPPNIRIWSDFKRLPAFWKIGALRWSGDDAGLGIIARLDGDASLAEQLWGGPEVKIFSYGGTDYIVGRQYGGWLLSINSRYGPSRPG